MSNRTQLVQKLWNYCTILCDDGVSDGDYMEQLTFLLFLKMADEQSRPPHVKVAEPSRLCSEETNQRRDAAATVAQMSRFGRTCWPTTSTISPLSLMK